MRTRLLPLLLLVLPLWWLSTAHGQVLGLPHMDMVGHLSTMLHCSMGEPLHTTMVAWPQGADLLVIVGGWLDIFLACGLVEPLGLVWAYNLVFAFYVLLGGVGILVLSRELGASLPAAVLGGLLLQLDGLFLYNLTDGRLEQGALGLSALAVAGAVHTWRNPGWLAAVGTGLAGAAVVYASWELAMLLALTLVLLLPWLWRMERAPGVAKRWGLAAGIAFALAAPWAGLFLVRALEVRSLHEGGDTVSDALFASVPLLRWLGYVQFFNPSTLAMVALLALPWTHPRRDRALWGGVAVVLGFSLLMALGPDPSLFARGDTEALKGLGPWRLAQATPLLGWFHTPDRFLLSFSLFTPVAAALAVDALARRKRWLGALLALVMVGTAFSEVRWTDWWPAPHFQLPNHDGLIQLAHHPDPGAVLDLPVEKHKLRTLTYQAFQLTHRRPIPYHMTSPLLTPPVMDEIMREQPLFDWLRGRRPLQESDLLALREYGFGFLVVHTEHLDLSRRKAMRRDLEAQMGPPDFIQDKRWWGWVLPTE